MDAFFRIALSLVAVIGHLALWITVWNHVEGTAMPRFIRRSLTLFVKVAFLLIPLSAAIVGFPTPASPAAGVALYAYGSICVLIAGFLLPYAIFRRRTAYRSPVLKKTTTTVHDFRSLRMQWAAGAPASARLLLGLPGNQALELEESEKTLVIPRLPQRLDGLTIVHLSDLHLNGSVGRAYFQQIVDLINDMQPDLVAVTGDLIDRENYLSWLPSTLGRIRSHFGAYFVLGNHDVKVPVRRLRLMLKEAGLRDLGGRWRRIEVAGSSLMLAGNELPWIAPAADMSDCPDRYDVEQVRVLLAHSPDQLDWARRNDFDLMLAGHTHGGQICLPLVGPIICPSRKPLEYATGTIFEDPTVMHVSRGVAAEFPIRINCRPELVKLVLQVPSRLEEEKAETFDAAQPVDVSIWDG